MPMMLQALKSFIYNTITSSGILFYLFPVLKYIIGFLYFDTSKAEEISDEGGASMKITKLNGKIYPAFPPGVLSAIKDVKVRKDDVMLCGYPKTGCHWTFEILSMLLRGKPVLSKYGKGFEGMLDAMPQFLIDSLFSPRVLNSHLPFEDLPTGIKENKNKIILTFRNPKDTVVSFYHHTVNIKMFYKYEGTFDNYFKMFIKGQLEYGDYFEFYRSWNRVMNGPNRDRILFLEFEELKEKPVKKIREIAHFLEISITPEFAEEIAKVSNFDNMKKKREGTTKIFRKGIVGDWKNTLTDAQGEEVDKVWREKMADFKLPSGRNVME